MYTDGGWIAIGVFGHPARRGFESKTCPNDFVPAFPQKLDRIARYILVGKNAQGKAVLCVERVDSFIFQHVLSVGETGQNVFPRDARVVVQHLGLGPALGQQADDELNGQSRSFDDRFSHKHGGVGGDSIFPGHGILKAKSSFRSAGTFFYHSFLPFGRILQEQVASISRSWRQEDAGGGGNR